MKRWAWMAMMGMASVALARAAIVPPPAPPGGVAASAKGIVQLKKLEVQPKLLTPQYQVSPTPPASKVPRYWCQMTIHFDTHQDWTDDLDFRCYVLLKPKTGALAGKVMLLQGDVTLINVAKGKHKCDFFVHPSTLLRYGDVEQVAVEVKKAGQMLGMMSQPQSLKRWWEDYPPVPNMVLKRADTPWALINYDDCEQVKESAPVAR